MTATASGSAKNPSSDDEAQLVHRARAGDAAALDKLLRSVKDRIYGVALRMLWHPEDAEDATQEILLKAVTALAAFRGESSFVTWVLRIATNHLLNFRRSRVEREEWTFADLGRDLMDGLDAEAPRSTEPDQLVLEEEVKIGCTQAMLQCLDRKHRVAYIVGEIFQLSSEQASVVLDISPSAYRQQLARARRSIRGFMQGMCGLVNHDSPCRCRRRIRPAIAHERVDPNRLLFATHPRLEADAVRAAVDEMEALHTAADVFRSHPAYAAPETMLCAIRAVISGSS